MDALRRIIFPGRRNSEPARTPFPAAAHIDLPSEQQPLRPAAPCLRPRLAMPPVLQTGASIPPQVGERAYYNTSSIGCLAWEINADKTVCHFSAPGSFYPGDDSKFVGVVKTVEGACHHVPAGRPFSVAISDDNQPPHSGQE